MAKTALQVLVVYNEPSLPVGHPDYAQEAGVLESVAAVRQALNVAGHQVRELAIHGEARQVLSQLQHCGPADVVFNLCEGLGGVGRGEAEIAGLLELIGYQLTGSPADCLSLVRNKVRTKLLLAGAGLPTAEFCSVSRGETEPTAELERLLALGPVIVKPANEDASLGIGPQSICSELVALRIQIARVCASYGCALVERYIDGREFNAAVIALPEPRVLPLAEIEFDRAALGGWNIVSYDAKWSVGSAADRATVPRCPAAVDSALAAQIERIALEAFRVTGCRDFARVDLRVDQQGRPFVLEVNGNPDLSPGAGLARALGAAGFDYENFLVRLVEQAASRGAQPVPAVPATAIGASNCTAPVLRLLQEDDVPLLYDLLKRCAVFRDDELAVGLEVLTEAARQGPDGDYHVTVAEHAGRPIGWACRGLVPLTDATYDLYWIAVDPDYRSLGLGQKLVRHIQQQLHSIGGRWLLAETSAAPEYDKTRQFYLRSGFELLSSIPDFYRGGDGRLIFGLRLDRAYA